MNRNERRQEKGKIVKKDKKQEEKTGRKRTRREIEGKGEQQE